MKQQRKPAVAIIYRCVPQYRRRFYQLLKERLELNGIELRLIYGQPGSGDAARMDSIEVPWAYKIRNHIIKLGGREVYWQPCLGLLDDVDLVIVEQASKLLLNYLLIGYQLLGIKRVAFWGHGKNFRVYDASRGGELVKRFLSRHVHWWFAYTDLSAEIVRSLGYPACRITNIQNSIDIRHLQMICTDTTPADIEALKQQIKLTGANVAIYVGSMYADKKIDFLLEVCQLVRSQLPDFEMIFVGAGPDAAVVRAAAERHSYLHLIGPRFDEEKVPYLMMAKAFLMPSAVGLGLLDAFALGVPMITRAASAHGPEIDYLVDRGNGILVADGTDATAYAAAVIQVLRNEQLRQQLVAGCHQAADRYSLESMVERFVEGISQALATH